MLYYILVDIKKIQELRDGVPPIARDGVPPIANDNQAQNDSPQKVTKQEVLEGLPLYLYSEKRDCFLEMTSDQVILGVEFDNTFEITRAIGQGRGQGIELQCTRDDGVIAPVHYVTLTDPSKLNFTIKEIIDSSRAVYMFTDAKQQKELFDQVVNQITQRNSNQGSNDAFYTLPNKQGSMVFFSSKQPPSYLAPLRQSFRFWFSPEQMLLAIATLDSDGYKLDNEQFKMDLAQLWNNDSFSTRMDYCKKIEALIASIGFYLKGPRGDCTNLLQAINSRLEMVRDSFHVSTNNPQQTNQYCRDVSNFVQNVIEVRQSKARAHFS